jgi:hypothetical protein
VYVCYVLGRRPDCRQSLELVGIEGEFKQSVVYFNFLALRSAAPYWQEIPNSLPFLGQTCSTHSLEYVAQRPVSQTCPTNADCRVLAKCRHTIKLRGSWSCPYWLHVDHPRLRLISIESVAQSSILPLLQDSSGHVVSPWSLVKMDMFLKYCSARVLRNRFSRHDALRNEDVHQVL